MITGDYPATAAAIAREAGLAREPVVLSGTDLDGMSEATLRERVRDIDVFARVVPDQKLRIVEGAQVARRGRRHDRGRRETTRLP
jgi:Ca2+-transporting ATPase